MATYAIGDVQGCFEALKQLLEVIHFNEQTDTLWFTGDLVNRGPQSLEVLRLISRLRGAHQVVLGNHDLHLLAVAHRARTPHRSDTLEAVLSAPDSVELLAWLRARPLLVRDEARNIVMTHAGLAPSWTVEKAAQLASEVETALRSDAFPAFLANMYGNQPDHWDDQLTGMDRLRCITNYLTRMRLCYPDGRLDLTYKGNLEDRPRELLPWFEVTHRANAGCKIIFGHWAALGGKADVPNIYPLDTGCVWGNCLTALRLEDERLFSVACRSSITKL